MSLVIIVVAGGAVFLVMAGLALWLVLDRPKDDQRKE